MGQKRGSFIGLVHSLLQEFHFVSPEIMVTLLNSYGTAFYGSTAWNLFGNGADRIYKAWNVAIWQIYNLDRKTHTFLIEPVSNTSHLKIKLMSRFISFYKSLQTSEKFIVRFITALEAEDMRSTLGRNLNEISRLCGVHKDDLTPAKVKGVCSYKSLSDEEMWKLNLAEEVLNIKNANLTIHGFEEPEIDQIFHYLCIS